MTSKYDIAAKVELASLDGYEGRLTAAQQREVFGRYIFGKKVLKIDAGNQGKVSWFVWVCFGTDHSCGEFSFEEIAELASNPDHPVSF